MHSVIKPWVFTLPFRMQSVLLLSLRGCDGVAKDDHSKAVTRTLRGLVFNNADPTNTFITDAFPAKEKVEAFLWDLDAYPMHFVMHTTHAAEIIGYKYPLPEEVPAAVEAEARLQRYGSTMHAKDSEEYERIKPLVRPLHYGVRAWWNQLYRDLVKALHLNPETEAQLDVRLGFTDAEKKIADIPSPELLAAFQAALLADKQGFAQHIARHGYGVADPDDDTKWDAGTGTSHGGRSRQWSGGS